MNMNGVVMFSIFIACVIPILFLLFLRKFDLLHTGKVWKNFATLGGGVVAYWIATQINPFIVNIGWATWDQVIRISAPIIEEILKALIILYLISRSDSNYVVDGAIYGFGAGVGFAVVENIEYIINNPQLAFAIAFARVFSTNLVHATGSGIIGIALAYQRGEKAQFSGIGFVLLGYILAISFHALFNTMVSAGTFLAAAIIYGFVGFGFIFYIIKRGLNIQKEWVAQTLGEAERITQEEAKVIRYIETVDKVLQPIQQRFGIKKTQMMRALMFKQAEIGIKKKILESDTSEARKKETQKIIDTLLIEMEELRNKIGWNCMLLYRQVYSERALEVFSLLNARIAAAGPSQKGGGLWSTLADRMKQSTRQEENQL